MSWSLSIHGEAVAGSDSAPKYHAFDSDSDADSDAEDAKKGKKQPADKVIADGSADSGVAESKGDDADSATDGEATPAGNDVTPKVAFMEGDVVNCIVSVIHTNLQPGEVSRLA